MKTLNFIFFCYLFLFCNVSFLFAQVMYDNKMQPTENEKALDQNIQACLEDSEVLSQKFEFSEWTAQLHFHTRKMVQRMSSEYVSAIAIQKKNVVAVYELANNCPELEKVKKEIEDIYTIYDKKIVYQEEEANTDLFEDEEIQAKMEKGDAEDLLKKLEKLQKKLEITRYIIRIQ